MAVSSLQITYFPVDIASYDTNDYINLITIDIITFFSCNYSYKCNSEY